MTKTSEYYIVYLAHSALAMILESRKYDVMMELMYELRLPKPTQTKHPVIRFTVLEIHNPEDQPRMDQLRGSGDSEECS